MTRRLRFWITAGLTLAAAGLMVAVAVAAHAGVSHLHLAGLTFNGLD
jgi:hypothetical protein